ncbi:MAG TPA: hypothetical protein VMV10_23305 [Pirellulales bacterium]|nr:hypothetical protein [Pirellulales bacterium]
MNCGPHSVARACSSGASPAFSPPEQPIAPALWRKAINFTAAVFAQAPLAVEALLTGDETRAVRSREEIERIAAICKACPLFDGERCTHKHCGCPVNADRNAFLSKLAWKSQRCSDNPPRWGAEPAVNKGGSGPQDRPIKRWLLSFPPDAPTRHRSYYLLSPLAVEAPDAFGYYLLLADCGDWQRAELRFERRAADGREKAVIHVGPAALCWSSGWLPAGAFAARGKSCTIPPCCRPWPCNGSIGRRAEKRFATFASGERSQANAAWWSRDGSGA